VAQSLHRLLEQTKLTVSPAFLPLLVHRISQGVLASVASALPPPGGLGSIRGVLRPLLTSAIPSRPVARAVVPSGTGRQTSQGKLCILHAVSAGFTNVRVRVTIGRWRPQPPCPTTPALYPVPVRRSSALPSASFRSRLAADTLAWAGGSGHHGPQRTRTSNMHNMPGTLEQAPGRVGDRGLGMSSSGPVRQA
jgi:hypothetical protein